MSRLFIWGAMLAMAVNAWGATTEPAPTRTPRTIPAPRIDMKIPLYDPAHAPAPAKGAKPETIINDRYYYVSAPELHVYLPPKGKANGTALIIFPGGGFTRLAMNLHVENVARLLTDQGITVFGLKYRTHNGEHDYVADATADAIRAIRVVRSRAKEFGIDPHKIGIQGYSAGSTLILRVLGRFYEKNPKGEDPASQVGSRPDFAILMCPWPNGKTLGDYPFEKNLPPVFLCQARDDEAVPLPFALGIVDSLKKNGAPVETFLVEQGGHAAFHYGDGDNKGEGTKWPEHVLPWLKKIGMMP